MAVYSSSAIIYTVDYHTNKHQLWQIADFFENILTDDGLCPCLWTKSVITIDNYHSPITTSADWKNMIL